MAFPLLLDAMIPRSLFQALQREGYQVKHALDLDFNLVQNDESLLEYVTEHRHVLFTCNYADPEDNFVQIDRQWHEQRKETCRDCALPANTNKFPTMGSA